MGTLIARLLGIFALIPFIMAVLAAWLDFGSIASWWQREYIVYFGAIVVSFTGAIHWGRALEGAPHAPLLYVFSVAPALLAWIGLMTGFPRLILILAFFLALGGDWYFLKKDQDKAWYVQLRIILTIAVMASLLFS